MDNGSGALKPVTVTLCWRGPTGSAVETAGRVRSFSTDRQVTIELLDPRVAAPPLGWSVELVLASGEVQSRLPGCRGLAPQPGTIEVQLTDRPGPQRRRYVRAQVDLPALVLQLDSAGDPTAHAAARLIDLGGGGVRFLTNHALQRDELIRLGFTPGAPPVISPVVRILDTRPAESAALAGWGTEARGAFEMIGEDERHRVFQYVRGLAAQEQPPTTAQRRVAAGP